MIITNPEPAKHASPVRRLRTPWPREAAAHHQAPSAVHAPLGPQKLPQSTWQQYPCPNHACCPQIQRTSCFYGHQHTSPKNSPDTTPPQTPGRRRLRWPVHPHLRPGLLQPVVDTRNTQGTQHSTVQAPCQGQTRSAGAFTCPDPAPGPRIRTRQCSRPELLRRFEAHGARLGTWRGIHASGLLTHISRLQH